MARGALVGWLDADDIWVAGVPDPRRPALKRGADVVLGRVQAVAGTPPVPVGGTMPGVQLGAMLARREALDQLGGIDDSLQFSEDFDLVLRMREADIDVQTIDDVTVHYRQRAGSLTRDRSRTDAGIVSAIRASLERRGQV